MRFVSVTMLVCLAAACQKEDPRMKDFSARLEKLEKRVDVLEKRPPAAAAAPPQRRGPDPQAVYKVPVAADDVVRGDQNAKVTIVEGFDFACPYCAMSRPAVQALIGKRKDVRVVSKQFVVHPDTATLPALAVCAGTRQGKGHELEDAIWASAWPQDPNGRPRLDVTALQQEKLEAAAKELGLNLAKLKADMTSDGCKQWLQRQQQELASVGVNGTPAFFVNGRVYNGPRTPEGFNAAIDEELKRAGTAATN